MQRVRINAMRASLALGAAFLPSALANVQGTAAPVTAPDAVQPLDIGSRPAFVPGAGEHRHDHEGDLRSLVASAGQAFDGVLVSASVSTPPGMRVLVTRYVFEVSEWFKGERAVRTVELISVGGEEADGSGMTTCESLRLAPGGRYLVFAKPGSDALLLPFMRVFQIHHDGAVVADENGRVVVELRDGMALTRPASDLAPLRYLPEGPADRAAPASPPEFGTLPVPEQPRPEHGLSDPLPLSALTGLLRNPGAAEATPDDPAGPDAHAGHEHPLNGQGGPGGGGTRWNWCGYHRDAINYYLYLPNDTNYNWFASAASDWNTLVQTSAGGPDWLIGQFLDGSGNPIRNRLPDADDGDNNLGVPSSAQLTAGGYGTWASYGNPNGINFTWYTGGNCTRIDEVDTFANPTLISNEVQFRKTLTHEIGHALSLGHENRYAALMVSGTWRIPPNYASTWYNRADDLDGARAMIAWVNTNWPGTWVLENWADMAAWSQTHPDLGNPADVVMTELSTYSAQRGQTIQIRRVHVENRGTLSASNVNITFYLSTNNIISSTDHVVWSGGWDTFGANQVWANGTLDITIPNSLPVGAYYIGWIVSTPTSELSSANNSAIMMRDSSFGFSERTLSVTCPSISAPTGVSATDGSLCDRVRVSWTASAGATGYTVWRHTSNNSGSAVELGSDTASPFDDATATPGTTYFYWVRATSGCGTSGFSASNSGYRDAPPVAPTNVNATDGAFCDLTRVSWNASAGAAGYTVWRNTANNSGGAVQIGTDAASPFDDDTGAVGTNYYYWVRATDGCGSSPFSTSNQGRSGSRADIDGNGAINVQDFLAFLSAYDASSPLADFDGNGVVNIQDVLAFLSLYSAGCP